MLYNFRVYFVISSSYLSRELGIVKTFYRYSVDAHQTLCGNLCQLARLSTALADNTLPDFHNSSNDTKAELNNCSLLKNDKLKRAYLHEGCSAPKIFSKQLMSSVELSSCCSCYVFSKQFACIYSERREVYNIVASAKRVHHAFPPRGSQGKRDRLFSNQESNQGRPGFLGIRYTGAF